MTKRDIPHYLELFVADTYAAVIDTGTGIGSLKEAIRSITDLPLIVINTHGHPDHGGGNGEFSDCPIYMHPADKEIYEEMCSVDFRIHDLKSAIGDVSEDILRSFVVGVPNTIDMLGNQTIDIGNRSLEVIEYPGHTPGSVGLFEKETGYLFIGDTMTETDTWMYMPHCEPFHVYVAAFNKILEIKDRVTKVFAGHLSSPLSIDIVDKKLSCAHQILRNPDAGQLVKTFAGEGLRQEFAGTGIIYNKFNM